MDQKKIVLFSPSIKYVQFFLWPIIEYISTLKFVIYIATPSDTNLIKNHKNKNIIFIKTPYVRGLNKISHEIKCLLSFRKIIREINPDTIFSYTLKTIIYTRLVNKRTTNANFITGLGSGFIYKRYRPFILGLLQYLRLRDYFCGKLDHFIFLNSSDREYFISKKLTSAYNSQIFPGEGINTLHYQYCPPNSLNKTISFLFIGRLIKHKGIYELLKACQLLKNDGTPFVCTIIAPRDIENPSKITNITNMIHDNENVHYIPYTNNIKHYIENHTAVVLPSYGEGLPRALLETMSIGRPIITCDVNGCNELITHNKNGLLVPAKDSEALFHAMKTMARLEKKKLINMGLLSAQIIKENYTTKAVLKCYEQLLTNKLHMFT